MVLSAPPAIEEAITARHGMLCKAMCLYLASELADEGAPQPVSSGRVTVWRTIPCVRNGFD